MPMGRPREFDEETVVERAMQSFWTHGYAGTSPARLTEATGLGKGSLYNAFHSKRALFERCLERYNEQVSSMAHELLERPGTTVECLRTALRTVVDMDLAQPHRRGCLIGNTVVEMAGEDSRLSARLKQMQDMSTECFAARIRQGQLDGDVAPDRDPQALADHLATVLAGLRVMAMTHDGPTLYRVIDTSLAPL